MWYVADARRRVGSIAVRRTNGSIGTYMPEVPDVAAPSGVDGVPWYHGYNPPNFQDGGQIRMRALVLFCNQIE